VEGIAAGVEVENNAAMDEEVDEEDT